MDRYESFRVSYLFHLFIFKNHVGIISIMSVWNFFYTERLTSSLWLKVQDSKLKLNIFRSNQHMDIDVTRNVDEYTVVDGRSSIQTNGFDCGVFSLMNIEKYLTDRPVNHPINQQLMMLFRLRILNRLFNQSIELGLVE